MSPSSTLPLPLAALARRARNAKSVKQRHDIACFAWQAAVRLAAATSPRLRALPRRPALADWVAAVEPADARIDNPAVLAAFAALAEASPAVGGRRDSVSTRELLECLPPYFDAAVGHDAARAPERAGAVAETLVAGLEALWEHAVLVPADGALVYIESIEIDTGGGRRARVLELTASGAVLVDPQGADVSEAVIPKRVYLRRGDRYSPLHPWLLFETAELNERVLFFERRGRSARYLDFVSGDELFGHALEVSFPDVESALDDAFSSAGGTTLATDDPPDTSALGNHELLGKLGEGGMGVVYLARQRSLDRLVALKTLPSHLEDDQTAIARFRREVHALARCEHPNVIKVYGAGVDDRTHYYTMELIIGANLGALAQALSTADDFGSALGSASERTRHSERETFDALPIVSEARDAVAIATGRERIPALARLFRDAARGVAHLHEQGIVHRDIKPSNLMVTEGEGRIVVMDLGLAAVTDSTRSLTKDRTAILGTLKYMPPEQLQRNILQVDRRADIYSLSATFYELLTGRPFFDGDSDARLIEQVLREDPTPVRTANASVPEDLARIIEKASAKDPRLRYESADALADDLEAYLEGRPIRARPPSIGYLLRRAATRNRAVVVGVGAALVGLLATSTVGGAIQERQRRARCADPDTQLGGAWNDEARQAVSESVLATGVAHAGETAARVGTGLDGYSERWMAVRAGACIGDEGRLPSELHTAQVLCLAARKDALGALVQVLSESDVQTASNAVLAVNELKAPEHCSDVARLAAKVKPPDGARLVEQVDTVRKQLVRAGAMEAAGQYRPALELARSLEGEARELPYPPLLAEALLRTGALLKRTGDYRDAETRLREAYGVALANGHDEVAAAAATLLVATVGSHLGRHAAGLDWGFHAEASVGRAGFDSARHAMLLNNLGSLATDQGDYDRAIDHHRRALELRQQAFGLDDPSVAHSLNNLGDVHFRRGSYDEALEYHQRAHTTWGNALGPEHPQVAMSLNNLGSVYTRQGAYAKALDHHQQALTIRKQALGPEHPLVAMTLNNLGNIHATLREHDEAAQYFEEAVGVLERALGPRHPDFARALGNLGNNHFDRGRHRESLELHERALEIQKQALGLEHPHVGDTLNSLAGLHRARGELDEALELYGRALAIREAALGTVHPHVALSLFDISLVHDARETYDDSVAYARRALAILELKLGPHHPNVASTLYNLGQTELKRGHAIEAASALERALDLRMRNHASELWIAHNRQGLAEALWAAGERNRALELAEQARATYRTQGASAAQHLAEAEQWVRKTRRR